MFKQIMSVLLIISMMLCSFSLYTAATPEYKLGDINGDTNITAADALLVLQYSVGKITLNSSQLAAADTDGNASINAADALQVLQYSVGKIKVFLGSLSPEERYYYQRDLNYNVDYSDFNEIVSINDYNDASEVVEKLGGNREKANVDAYKSDSDGSLLYNPLSKNISSAMDSKYKNSEKATGTINLGGSVLNYSVPKNVTAYDTIPIEYSISSSETTRPLHVEATAFDETDRYDNKTADYYDCTLPGNISLEMSYEGYVSGSTNSPSTKPKLKLDPANDIKSSEYPAYSTEDLNYSGTIKAQQSYTWFKFKYTNTGNTILDGEGNGAFNIEPILFIKNSSGKYEQYATTPNWYQPLTDYVYPGESVEFWALFSKNNSTRLSAGDYKIVINGRLRSVKSSYNYSDSLSYSTVVTQSEFEFTVTADGGTTAPAPMKNTTVLKNIPRNRWLGNFEEFLTSFNSLKTVSSNTAKPTSGRLYLQVAPFSKTVVLKLINGDNKEIKTVKIPVNVESDSIKINLNPYNNNYFVKNNGTRTPLIMTQNMADMRGNIDRGPYTADTIINDLKNMKEAGINYLTTTETATADYTGYYDSTMFMLDCARKLDFKVEGHATYYYRSNAVINTVKRLISDQDFGNRQDIFGLTGIDSANGIAARINFIRYGDLFYGTNKGILPISIEENYGWMGHYLNGRYAVPSPTFDSMHNKWLEKVYGTIDKLNSAYNSNYSSFDDICVKDEGASLQAGPDTIVDLNDASKPFHDWTAATVELDLFRTVERMNNYKTFLDSFGVEQAKIALRCENSIYLAGGISPTTSNAHYRQIYYEQMRAAAIPEILAASDIIYCDSSYDATPFTPSEVYELTRQSAKSGFVSAKTPCFNHMSDSVMNNRYGTTAFTSTYNLKSSQMSCSIGVVSSLFTYWKAIYEAGGIPGTMWMDYACDSVVNSTQYKEMLFFNKKVNEMLNTDEGKTWASNFNPDDRSFESIVAGAYSYEPASIDSLITSAERKNLILNYVSLNRQ